MTVVQVLACFHLHSASTTYNSPTNDIELDTYSPVKSVAEPDHYSNNDDCDGCDDFDYGLDANDFDDTE